MKRLNSIGWIVSATILCLLCRPAWGIVLTENPDLHEVAPDSPFAAVGHLNTAGGPSGVLVGPRQVLTVAHAVNNINGATFSLDTVNGREVWDVESKTVMEGKDLAILTLGQSTGMQGVSIYEGDDEQGRLAAMVGYGYSGIGEPDPQAYPIGTARVGYSRIDFVTSGYMQFRFSEPGRSGSQGADEGFPANGDSGGGIFIQVGGEWVLAGLHCIISDSNTNGVLPDYGDWADGIRLSNVSSWLDEQANVVPEPGTMVLLTLGGLVVTVRRRR
jgi:hypothetical protein